MTRPVIARVAPGDGEPVQIGHPALAVYELKYPVREASSPRVYEIFAWQIHLGELSEQPRQDIAKALQAAAVLLQKPEAEYVAYVFGITYSTLARLAVRIGFKFIPDPTIDEVDINEILGRYKRTQAYTKGKEMGECSLVYLERQDFIDRFALAPRQMQT